MISAPRTPPTPCPHGCTCTTCTDDLTAWAAQLHNRPGDRLPPWNLQRDRPRRRHPRNDRTFDVSAFEEYMANLSRRITEGGQS